MNPLLPETRHENEATRVVRTYGTLYRTACLPDAESQRVLLEKLRAKHTRMSGWFRSTQLSYADFGWAYWTWWIAMLVGAASMSGSLLR